MKIQLLKALWKAGRAATRGMVIHDYREFLTRSAGRALVSYLVHPLLPPARFRDRTMFSPFGIAQEIPRALNELGYLVDIVNFDNQRWQPRTPYDLFIGHGGRNFERLAACIGSRARKIYFATGLYWREWNRRSADRVQSAANRTGWLLPSGRGISWDEESANALADGIVFLGNARAGETFAQFSHIYGIDNAAYPVCWEGWMTKDYDAGRGHFLFYQGPGNLHKGLDRVLEAFDGSPWHLHICQQIEPEFARAYHRLLYCTPNIHVYQFIRQRAAQFYDLASRCNWVLSATCAEGQPGSIVETMAHGLIPILPEAANIDVGPWGIELPDCTVRQIAETCAAAAALPASTCRRMASEVVAETRQRYSVEHFRATFQDAVRSITGGD